MSLPNFVGRGTQVGRGEDVHADAIGTLSFGGSAPMRRDTLFRIASLTKPVSGAAAMVLVEDGKLRLTGGVRRQTTLRGTSRIRQHPRSKGRRPHAGGCPP